MDDKNIMKYDTVLPENFDGVFRFTNWSNEEFIGKWGGKEYHFASNSTSPMIIPEHSPLEIQNIRKKFAKDLAEREFFKSSEYKSKYLKQEYNSDGTPKLNSIHQAGQYTLNDLTGMIQACLKPLEVKRAAVKVIDKTPLEDVLTKDEDGELNTHAISQKMSLRERALKGQSLSDS